MTARRDSAAPAEAAGSPRGELRVVGTTVQKEMETLLDRVEQLCGRRSPRVLQVGSRPSLSDRNERNWRSLIGKRFGPRAKFIGIDLEAGANVDTVLDICSPPRALKTALGEEPFDLVICCHVLEHTQAPMRAARNIESLLRPGGLAYVATPWSQAFHAMPNDFWRFSQQGLMLMFDRLDVVSSFYSGGDVGLDVAYRVERDGGPDLTPRAGAVEHGLFQLVLDHADNKDVLARQATQRLPVSRAYLPTLFVNLVGSRRR